MADRSDTSAGDFFVGQEFDNLESAKTFLAQFNKKHFCDFVIRTNNKRSLVAVCKHGIKRKSDSKGAREHLHYNFVDCKAKINFYKSQVSGSTKLKVTILNTEHHGHVISEDLYNRLNVNITEEETELIKTLAGANARPSQIKKLMLEKSKKRLTVQKNRNIAAKILPPENDEECQ